MMKKIHRRLLFLGFCGFFAVIAPLILLNAAGYRIDEQSWRIRRTGLLVVDINDRDAMVSLNGIPARGTTRDRHLWFERLLPGTVHVRVEKAGYLPWEKQYRINEGLTTFTSPVLLLPHQGVKKIADGVFSLLPATQLTETPFFVKEERKKSHTFWRLNGSSLESITDIGLLPVAPYPPSMPIGSRNLVLVSAPDGVRVNEQYTQNTHGTKPIAGETVAKLPKGSWSFLPSPEEFPTLVETEQHQLVVIDRLQSTQLHRGPIRDAQWNVQDILAVLELGQVYIWDASQGTTQTTAVAPDMKLIALPTRLPIVFLADHHTLIALERASADPFQQTLLELADIRQMRVTPDGSQLLLTGSDAHGAGVFVYDFP